MTEAISKLPSWLKFLLVAVVGGFSVILGRADQAPADNWGWLVVVSGILVGAANAVLSLRANPPQK